MASSPLTLSKKSSYHARSVSLPSRSHPLIPHINEHLCRVRASSEATCSSISNGLSGLEDLYDCVDDLLLLPHAQQALAHQQWVDEALEGYLRLLDVCASAKDVMSQTKQEVQDLLSILRRRRNANDFGEYLSSRKKAKKVIQKSLKSVKNKRTLLVVAMDKDHETHVAMLNEVEAATVAVFESLLSYAMGRTSGGWSLVSKLMHHKSEDELETDSNEFEKVDAALQSLIGQKASKSDNNRDRVVEHLQNQLGKLESGIQDVEGGLDCLFRRLIKTRVSLLNILNH